MQEKYQFKSIMEINQNKAMALIRVRLKADLILKERVRLGG